MPRKKQEFVNQDAGSLSRKRYRNPSDEQIEASYTRSGMTHEKLDVMIDDLRNFLSLIDRVGNPPAAGAVDSSEKESTTILEFEESEDEESEEEEEEDPLQEEPVQEEPEQDEESQKSDDSQKSSESSESSEEAGEPCKRLCVDKLPRTIYGGIDYAKMLSDD